MTDQQFDLVYAQRTEERFVEHVTAVTAQLKRIIEDVERTATGQTLVTTSPFDVEPRTEEWRLRTATSRAGEVANLLTWGLANCNLRQLITAAAEADAARGRVEAGQAAP